MKIKSILMAIALCLILVLAGCGGSKEDAAPEHHTKENQSDKSATEEATQEVTTPEDISSDNAFTGSVWLGTKKDFMYEYRLEFTGNDTVYLVEMLDGNIERVEKSSYTQDGEEIDFSSLTLIENEDYDSATQRISITLPGSGLLIYFRPADEPLMDTKVLDTFIEDVQPAEASYTIDGWPSDIPFPDFGGEIRSDKSASGGSGPSSRTIRFQDIDPDKVQPYLDALVAAGFEITEQSDKLLEEETDENGNHKFEPMVDENGDPFYTHRFEALNGEIVENEFFSSLESGYYIEITYTLQKQYDKATGQFIGNPYLSIYLSIAKNK